MNLKNSFGISVPTKCHIIFRHVKDFIQEKRQPIGLLSEQVVEATHSKWSNIWDNYKVRHLHREEYGDKILRKEFFKNSIFPPYLPKLRNSKKNYKCNKEFMHKFDHFIDSKVNIN